MIQFEGYKKSFIAAVIFHFLLAILLLVEFHSARPVLTKETDNQTGDIQAKQEVIKAVSVDNQELMQAVNKIKQERTKQEKAEKARQQELVMQAESAKRERLKEQEHLSKLKAEAEKIALQKKQELAEEQKRLKLLALEKEKEAKKLEELKKQQKLLEKKQDEEKKHDELKKKQQEARDKAKAEADLAKAEQARAEQANAELAAENAARRQKLAGEVDKYKALIINAISRRWILPENVNPNLSSQFSIRLAPDGAVLDVKLLRTSGDPVLDRSAQTAIYKASPLPVPSDPATFDLFREISLTVRPENIRG